jgi:hypothetical protein
MRLKFALLFLVFVVGLAAVPNCAKAPPTLSPVSSVKFEQTRIIKGLDVLRDIAVSANQQIPPVLPETTTRAVVTWHRSALVLIDGYGAGWATTVGASLDEVIKNLPPPQQATLAPYVALVHTILNEVK